MLGESGLGEARTTQDVFAALVRLVDPFGGHTWTQLAIPDCPQKIAQGQPFAIKGELAGIIPGQIWLWPLSVRLTDP